MSSASAQLKGVLGSIYLYNSTTINFVSLSLKRSPVPILCGPHQVPLLIAHTHHSSQLKVVLSFSSQPNDFGASESKKKEPAQRQLYPVLIQHPLPTFYDLDSFKGKEKGVWLGTLRRY